MTKRMLYTWPVTQSQKRRIAAEILTNEIKQVAEWWKLVYAFAPCGAVRDGGGEWICKL